MDRGLTGETQRVTVLGGYRSHGVGLEFPNCKGPVA